MFTTTNSWSKQVLVSEECRKGDEVRTENALIVCNQNLDLFQKEFIDSKHLGDITPIIPFDFIVLGGNPCPRGKFYEVEYTLGGKHGVVHRALIQAVDPVTDIQLILGTLNHKGAITDDIVTHKAYLRDDIDAVRIVGCYKDEETEDAYIGGNRITPREEEYSILDTVIGRDPAAPFMVNGAVCLELYAAEHSIELWIDPDDKFAWKPVFVCGSQNVWDEAFAEQRQEDLAELQDHIGDAIQLLNEYGLQYLICYENGKRVEGSDRQQVNLMNRCVPEFATAVAEFINQKQTDDADEQV